MKPLSKEDIKYFTEQLRIISAENPIFRNHDAVAEEDFVYIADLAIGKGPEIFETIAETITHEAYQIAWCDEEGFPMSKMSTHWTKENAVVGVLAQLIKHHFEDECYPDEDKIIKTEKHKYQPRKSEA